MECWEHVTIVREIVRGEDSPVGKCDTREGRLREKRMMERQVSNDQSPHVEEQSRSKGSILQQQGRRYEKGRKL